MEFKDIIEFLKSNLDKYRYEHTLRVVSMGETLAEKFNFEDVNKVRLACYLHDAGKNISHYEILNMVLNEGMKLTNVEIENVHIFHGIASMVIARDKFKISDIEVLNAIKNHVTGVENMSMLDKIVFLADFFEEGRNYDLVHESRDAALIELNINKSLVLACDSIIKDLIVRGKFIHENTLKTRNFALKNVK